MTGVRYKIPMLSAKAILAYAKPTGEDIYTFNLNKAETASALLNHGETYQDDNAVFYQLLSMLHRDGYSPKGNELIIDDLYDAIIYLDFTGIFDRSAEYPKNALRQKRLNLCSAQKVLLLTLVAVSINILPLSVLHL